MDHPKLNVPLKCALLSTALSLSACAGMNNHGVQNIDLVTDPPGAHCTFTQKSTIVAEVDAPATVTVPRSWSDMEVGCYKDGYKPAEFKAESGGDSDGLVDMVTPFGIGAAVDDINGTNRKYDDKINITLAKEK